MHTFWSGVGADSTDDLLYLPTGYDTDVLIRAPRRFSRDSFLLACLHSVRAEVRLYTRAQVTTKRQFGYEDHRERSQTASIEL